MAKYLVASVVFFAAIYFPVAHAENQTSMAELDAALPSADTPKLPPAKWIPLANTLFLLEAAEGGKSYLGASMSTKTHNLMINIFDLSNNKCANNESPDIHPTTPIKINGRFVKFAEGCINGVLIKQPESDAGKQYLNQAVESGHPVTVDAQTGPVLHYPGGDTSSLRKRLQAAQDAL